MCVSYDSGDHEDFLIRTVLHRTVAIYVVEDKYRARGLVCRSVIYMAEYDYDFVQE